MSFYSCGFGVCDLNYGNNQTRSSKHEKTRPSMLDSVCICLFIIHYFVSTKKACDLPPSAKDQIFGDKTRI